MANDDDLKSYEIKGGFNSNLRCLDLRHHARVLILRSPHGLRCGFEDIYKVALLCKDLQNGPGSNDCGNETCRWPSADMGRGLSAVRNSA
jgi:hypothetical protein